MKKHNYLNKSQKILLASMLIPLAVCSIPIENVSANTVPVPSLNGYESNGSVKLEWATEMPKENILSTIDYEGGPNAFYLNMGNQYDYLQTISSEGAFSGKYGYVLNDNSNNKGNFYGPSNMHYLPYDRYYFPNGTNISMTFKAKSTGTSTIEPAGDGGWATSLEQLNNKLVRNHGVGETVLHLDSVNHLYAGYYITTDTNPNVPSQMLYITSVDTKNNTITLNGGINRALTAGSNLVNRPWRPAYNFPTRTISNTDWQTFSINTKVYDFADYNVATQGASFYIVNRTDGKLLIDDITFGYATEVEIYRDGRSVYKGFLSDFQDNTAKDISKPNKVNTMNGLINSDFNVNFYFNKPTDNGTKYDYQIQSISKSGIRSQLSETKSVVVKSDVKSFKYSISESETDNPNTDITSNNFNIPLQSLDIEKDYIHIQTIDNNGNASDVQSFKVKNIIDLSSMDKLQNAYDRIAQLEQSGNFQEFLTFEKEIKNVFANKIPKDLQERIDKLKEKNLNNLLDKLTSIEKSNNYYDFVDFIDEVESLLGVELPEELYNRIDELAKHHGVNTSFLLLEEGDFRITTADIHDFGQVKLTAKKQTITTSFKDDFGVIDARGTQQGWNMTVSATPFTVDIFEGFVGEPHQLPVGSLALNVPTNVEQVGTVHNSKPPTITMNNLSVLDGENQTIKLLQADQHKGMGEFKFSFSEDALSLTVDAVTAKIDTVNYPNQNTPYVSTVTWDLISGPQI